MIEDKLFFMSLEVMKKIQKRDYLGLKKQGCLKRISEKQIDNIILDYGGTVNDVNEEFYRKYFQFFQLKGREVYMTYLDIIINDERSDLTLICEIEVGEDKELYIVIDDLHVM